MAPSTSAGAGHRHRGENLAGRRVDDVCGHAVFGVDIAVRRRNSCSIALFSCHDRSSRWSSPRVPDSHSATLGQGTFGPTACAGLRTATWVKRDSLVRLNVEGRHGAGHGYRIVRRAPCACCWLEPAESGRRLPGRPPDTMLFEHIVVADHIVGAGAGGRHSLPATGLRPSHLTPPTKRPLTDLFAAERCDVLMNAVDPRFVMPLFRGALAAEVELSRHGDVALPPPPR